MGNGCNRCIGTDGLLKNMTSGQKMTKLFSTILRGAISYRGNSQIQIVPLLEELADILDDDTMISLNYQVDELQRDPAEVAHEFLIEQGLVE